MIQELNSLLTKGKELYETGDLDAAEDVLQQVHSEIKKLLADNPSDEIIRLNSEVTFTLTYLYTTRAHGFQKVGDYHNSLKFSELALTYISINPEALFFKAFAHGQLGDDGQALKYIDVIISVCKDPEDYIIILSERLFLSGKFKLSLQILEKLLQHQPNNARALEGCLSIHFIEGRFRDAINYCDDLIRQGSDVAGRYLMRGHAKWGLRDFKGGTHDLEKVIDMLLKDNPTPADRELCRKLRNMMTSRKIKMN